MAIQVQVIVQLDDNGAPIKARVNKLHFDVSGKLYGKTWLSTWGDWLARSDAERNKEAVTFELGAASNKAGVFIATEREAEQ